MPPRIRKANPVYRNPWECKPTPHQIAAVHCRWTGLLLMAELSVGHTSFGEPRWKRTWGYGPADENGVLEIRDKWVLQWPCRACKAWFARPAEHRKHHDTANRLRVARLASYGPFSG